MFKSWPKIQRPDNLRVIITEKLDGTNACIIKERGEIVGVQSRKRLITPEDDNYGFAKWVHTNKAILEELPDGYNYGEWFGEGIQKNPHNIVGKKFCLFNTTLYNLTKFLNENYKLNIGCVKTLFQGKALDMPEEETLLENQPEGFIIYYLDWDVRVKVTHNNKKP